MRVVAEVAAALVAGKELADISLIIIIESSGFLY
jgi:hypothetical protein